MIYKKINFRNHRYDRPTAKYCCGEQCASPCNSGPSDNGTCPGTTECIPLKEGDRWLCSRSPKACEQGPTPSGECCKSVRCIPQKNYRYQRKRYLLWAFSFFVPAIILVLIFSSDDFLSPGPIHSKHQAITGMECSSCHVNEDTEFSSNLIYQNVSATGCINCHSAQHKSGSIHSDNALSSSQPLQCASCHKEHNNALSDAHKSAQLCTNCHASDSHNKASISLDNDTTNNSIQFSHNNHFNKYFISTKSNEFTDTSCKTCHDEQTQLIRNNVFIETCQGCHKKDTLASRNSTLFISIPDIDIDTLIANNIHIGAWPSELISESFTDATLAKLKQIPELQAIIQKITDEELDLTDLSEIDKEQLLQVQALILAFKRYLHDINTIAITGSQKTAKYDLRQSTLSELIRLSFPKLDDEVAAIENGQVYVTERHDIPISHGVNSNWKLADGIISLQAISHKDPFIGNWASAINKGEFINATDSLKDQLFSKESGVCQKCHTTNTLGHIDFQQGTPTRGVLYDHSLHSQFSQQSCSDCHGATNQHENQENSISQCLTCHQEKEVKLECNTCHIYHYEH